VFLEHSSSSQTMRWERDFSSLLCHVRDCPFSILFARFEECFCGPGFDVRDVIGIRKR
jgi:hypothetical protein